jgi:hypothetical protein
MRRGTPLKRFATIALAYALVLQALLGVWASSAYAGSHGIDPSLALCRTLAGGGEGQQSDDPATSSPHCAVMCLSGACAAADPPAAVNAAAEFPSLRAVSVSQVAPDGSLSSPAWRFRLNARGPPSIG